MTTHSWNESRMYTGSRMNMVRVGGCDGVLV